MGIGLGTSGGLPKGKVDSEYIYAIAPNSVNEGFGGDLYRFKVASTLEAITGGYTTETIANRESDFWDANPGGNAPVVPMYNGDALLFDNMAGLSAVGYSRVTPSGNIEWSADDNNDGGVYYPKETADRIYIPIGGGSIKAVSKSDGTVQFDTTLSSGGSLNWLDVNAEGRTITYDINNAEVFTLDKDGTESFRSTNSNLGTPLNSLGNLKGFHNADFINYTKTTTTGEFFHVDDGSSGSFRVHLRNMDDWSLIHEVTVAGNPQKTMLDENDDYIFEAQKDMGGDLTKSYIFRMTTSGSLEEIGPSAFSEFNAIVNTPKTIYSFGMRGGSGRDRFVVGRTIKGNSVFKNDIDFVTTHKIEEASNIFKFPYESAHPGVYPEAF